MTHEELTTLRIQAPHFFHCPNCGGNIEPEAIEEALDDLAVAPEDYGQFTLFCPGYTFGEGRCGMDEEATAAYWQTS